MPEVCATVNGEAVCMAVDLTVFDDPTQDEVTESPGDAPGAVRSSGVPLVRTRLAAGAIPDAWPRDERIPGELVKGQERVPCELTVQNAGDPADDQAIELLVLGEDVYRAVMGRAP